MDNPHLLETIHTLAQSVAEKMERRTKEKYPINEGWLHLKIKINPGVRISLKKALAMVGLTEETAEVPNFWHGKTVVNLTVRQKREPEPEKEVTNG